MRSAVLPVSSQEAAELALRAHNWARAEPFDRSLLPDRIDPVMKQTIRNDGGQCTGSE